MLVMRVSHCVCCFVRFMRVDYIVLYVSSVCFVCVDRVFCASRPCVLFVLTAFCAC